MGSYGQTILRRYLTLLLDDEPHEDYRPDWLFGMELDLYYPALNLGVEFQGDQHFIPVYGSMACIEQRHRDRKKKAICISRGVRFMRVEAIDLEYTRLNRLLKKAAGNVLGLRQFINRRCIRGQLRALNRESTAYRKTLNDTHGAVTSRRKGYKRRLAKYEWLSSHGFSAKPPTTPAEKKARREANRQATLEHKRKLSESGLTMLPP